MRCYQHVKNIVSTPVSRWIATLLDNNKLPIFDIIDDSVDETNGKFMEIYWMQQARCWGFDILNVSNFRLPEWHVNLVKQTKLKKVNNLF